MALIYANRIVMGKFEFINVPERYKEQVKQILIDNNREDLINE